jgi:hypothetical protein
MIIHSELSNLGADSDFSANESFSRGGQNTPIDESPPSWLKSLRMWNFCKMRRNEVRQKQLAEKARKRVEKWFNCNNSSTLPEFQYNIVWLMTALIEHRVQKE